MKTVKNGEKVKFELFEEIKFEEFLVVQIQIKSTNEHLGSSASSDALKALKGGHIKNFIVVV